MRRKTAWELDGKLANRDAAVYLARATLHEQRIEGVGKCLGEVGQHSAPSDLTGRLETTSQTRTLQTYSTRHYTSFLPRGEDVG